MFLLRVALLRIPPLPRITPLSIKPNYNAAAQSSKTHQILSDTQCLLLDPQLMALFDPELYGKSTWGSNGQQADDRETLLKENRSVSGLWWLWGQQALLRSNPANPTSSI